MLTAINHTTQNTTTYLYTDIANKLLDLNMTDNAMYSYLMANLSLQMNTLVNRSDSSNLTALLDGITSVQSDILFVKNNMFYQGNATGSFLVDYAATVYTQPGNREELWILTRDLLGNDKTVSSAECSIMKGDMLMYNATVLISPGGVHAYWDIASNQVDGEYYWNCTLTGSIMHLQVPFFVSNASSNFVLHDFSIDSLVAGSPRYPNEEALVEATFTNENGTAVDPDAINLTIYTSNGNVWTTATKQNFSKDAYNIWSYAKDIESNPTTGMYSISMLASYNGMTSSKTVQFRIATGGPYKVYLECPTSSYVGRDLICNVILKDEGEAATESISTVWVDENNNGIIDSGEPQAAFSKRTVPFQNVTQPVAINIPSTQINGLYNVRISTSYVNSAQPNSEASDSVLFATPPADTGTGGTTGGANGGTSSDGGSTGETGNNQIVTPLSPAGTGQTCTAPDKFRDVSVRVLDDYRVVAPDSKILVELVVYNLGESGIKNALVTYCIKKESGEIIRCLEENVTLSTKTQLIKEILLPKNMAEGGYYISAQVSYDNKTVSSEATFTVVGTSSASANNEKPIKINSTIGHMITSAVAGLDFYKVYMIILTVLITALAISLYHDKVKFDKARLSESVRERAKEDYAAHIRNVKESSSEISLSYSGGLSLTKPPSHAHEKSSEVLENKEDSAKEKSEKISVEPVIEQKIGVVEPKVTAVELKSVNAESKTEIKSSADIKIVQNNPVTENKIQESSLALERIKAILYITSFEDKAFVLSNNRKLRSIKDLLAYLPNMPDDVFNHHTKEGRNDFSNWIKGVFEEKELAKLVEKSETIEDLIHTLREYFRL
jgi:hypothetical protein